MSYGVYIVTGFGENIGEIDCDMLQSHITKNTQQNIRAPFLCPSCTDQEG